MERATTWGLLIGLAVVAALVWWFHFRDAPEAEPAAEPPPMVWPPPETQPEPPEEPAPPRYPLPEPEVAPDDEPQPQREPLPPLAESDDALRESLEATDLGTQALRLLMPSRLIERFVVTFNSLDQEEMAPLRMWPVRHARGVPEVSEVRENRYRWSEANHARYAPYVRALTAVDAATLAAIYRRFYPLLQEAYRALGLPQTHFNDRVIDILDHLIDGPEHPDSLHLRRPEVLYEFAEPELEALSAGHKILLRMGPDHAAVVQRHLRAMRAELVPE